MSFKDGRIGVGKDPIFPLDISGSCRIDGDLILGGRFSDSQGKAIQLGSGSGATSTPDQSVGGVPSWSTGIINTEVNKNYNRCIKSFQYTNWISADHSYPRALREGYLVLYENCLYQIGGEGSGRNDQTYKYSFRTNKWTQEFNAGNGVQAYHNAACVYKGKLFLWGGYLSNNYYHNLWAYDFNSVTWTTEIDSTTNMPPARYGQCGARKDNIFYYFGGRNSGGTHYNDLWYINLDDYNDRGLVNGGTVGSTLPPTRRGATMAYYNESLYVFGGSGHSDLWKFDLSNYLWQEITMVGNEPNQQTSWQARYAESPLIGNEMIIIYGHNDSTGTRNHNIYSINLDTYHYRKLLSTEGRNTNWYARSQPCACVVGNKIYTWGGEASSNRSDGIIFTFNRAPYTNLNHEIIKDDKFKTYSWSMFKRYAKTKGGDLPTAEYIKSNYKEFIQPGQDIWLPCRVKNYKEIYGQDGYGTNDYFEPEGEKDWIQIGDVNHPYGRLHGHKIDHYYGTLSTTTYPTWGDDNYTSHNFKTTIVIVYDTGANINGNLRVDGLIEGNQPYHWVCEIEGENTNDGGHGEPRISINGKDYVSTNLVAWRIDPKTGNVLGRLGHLYTYSAGSGAWNTLADEINSSCNNGDVICITNGDWIAPCGSSGSGYDLFTSAGLREIFNLPSGRVCYCAAFIKGAYGSIEKRGRSGGDNIKVRFSYLDLLNITDQKYTFNSTETTTAGGNNAFFGTLAVATQAEEKAFLHINATNNRNLRMTTKGGSHPGYQSNFTWGAHHIDVYNTSTIKGFGDTGNGGTIHLNYYSGGSVTGTSGTSITSDDRLKHNEKIITNGLDIINQLEPKKYFKSLKRYDEEHNYDLDSSGNPITDDHYKIETGLIAQQVMTISELKYLVDEVEDKYKIVNKEKIDESGNVILDDDGKPVIDEEEQISLKGRYTVSYQDIFVYNIAATKELDRKVITLENEKCDKAYLESKIETLTKENQEKIESLTKENYDQNVKIETLTKENQEKIESLTKENREQIETLTKENREKIETLTKENQEQNVKILDLYKENNILKARLEKIEAYLGI